MEKTRIVVWGVGKVGIGVVNLIAGKEGMEIVGAIDIDKEKVGKDLGEVAGIGRMLGVIVSDDADAVLARTKADMVLQLTAANWDETEAQTMKAVEAGCNVISTADYRLIYPWVDFREFGQRIDEAAKQKGVTVFETGRGYGFMFDLMPIVLTGVCGRVNKIVIKRVLDISTRSQASASSFGMGLTVEEYEKAVADGTITNRVAFKTSADLVAHALGWKLDEAKMILKPVTSTKLKMMAGSIPIEPGKVCGYRLLFSGTAEGKEVIGADMAWVIRPEEEGLESGVYAVSIDGDPNMDVSFKGFAIIANGVENCAMVVNHIPQIMAARSGLVNLTELPAVACLR